MVDDGSDCVLSPPIECVVYGWGTNEDGQLGFGEAEESVPIPRVVENLLGSRLRGREAGRTPLVAGSRMSLAIGAEGQIWSWGWNERGTLGHGDKCKTRMPTLLTSLRNVKVVQAAAGGWHALACTEGGKVYAWGGNEYGQCGVDADKRDIYAPMPCLPTLRVKQVACGGMHSLALTDEGDVYSWGERWGEFSLKIDKSPRQVLGAHNVLQITCGAFHNLALNADGDILAWGTNDFGQLGNGSTTYKTTPNKAVDLEGLDIVEVAAGGWHSMALTRDGEVYVWGRGEYGRLGLGDPACSSRLRPTKVPGLENHRIIQISAGGTHSAVLNDAGQMLIWGRGSFGRLAVNSTKNQLTPREAILPGGSGRWKVISIACGGRHTICLALPIHTSNKVDTVSEGSEGDNEQSDAVSTKPFSSLDSSGGEIGRRDRNLFGMVNTNDDENQPVNFHPRIRLRESSPGTCSSSTSQEVTPDTNENEAMPSGDRQSSLQDSPRTCVSLKEGILEGSDVLGLD